MLLWRQGNRNRWFRKGAAKDSFVRRLSIDHADAIKDISLRDDETGLSFFACESLAEAEQVTIYFAIIERERPQDIDYILFPDSVFADMKLAIVATPDPTTHAFLSERHREVLGLTTASIAELARRALDHDDLHWCRLKVTPLVAAAKLLAADPAIGNAISDEWKAAIGAAN